MSKYWHWKRRVLGEPSWLSNHVKTIRSQLAQARAETCVAVSAFQEAAASNAAEDGVNKWRVACDEAAVNQEWHLMKLAWLKRGWLMMDQENESRWLTPAERDLVPSLTAAVNMPADVIPEGAPEDPTPELPSPPHSVNSELGESAAAPS